MHDEKVCLRRTRCKGFTCGLHVTHHGPPAPRSPQQLVLEATALKDPFIVPHARNQPSAGVRFGGNSLARWRDGRHLMTKVQAQRLMQVVDEASAMIVSVTGPRCG
jgi:hypothetical protein